MGSRKSLLRVPKFSQNKSKTKLGCEKSLGKLKMKWKNTVKQKTAKY